MVLAPITVDVTSVPQTLPPASTTVIGLVAGLEDLSTVLAIPARPQAIRTLADVELYFGSAGDMYKACRLILSIVDVRIIGCMFSAADAATIEQNALDAIVAMERAVQITGFKPTLVSVPGFHDPANPATKELSTHRPLVGGESSIANDIVTQLKTTVEKLRAIGIADAAIAANTLNTATLWDENNGGERLLAIPQEVDAPAGDDISGAAFLAGNLARNDAAFGISDTFSNREVVGLTSAKPPRSFEYFGNSSDAVVLRNSNLTSVARDINGVWRVIGGIMKTADANDPLRYIGVRRLVDAIEARIVELAVNRWNRNQTDNFIDRLVNDADDYLQLLVSAGVLSRAFVIPDPASNTATARASGLVYIAMGIVFPCHK